MKKYLFIGVMILLLTSCAQDPRKQAEADRIHIEAASKAANEALNRTIISDQHEAEMLEQRATRDNRIAAWNALWKTFKIYGSISLAVSLLAFAFAVARTSIGVSGAIVTAAQVKANLIPLDRHTRQFPLLRHVHGTRYALHNPNTGSVVMLDAARNEDRQLIAAAGAVQLYGAVAEVAAKSDNEAIPMMSLPIIHPTEEIK